MMASSKLLAAFLALGWVGSAMGVKQLSDWQPGLITHYGGKQDGMDPSGKSFGTKDGACGYGDIPKGTWPYFSVAALSPGNSFYKSGPLMGCGQCFQIKCESNMDGSKDACKKDSKGQPLSILVMISDTCPECEADHIDVQSLAFAKMASPDIGRIKVTYRRVECAPPQNVKVSVMDFVGSNGWLRLAIEDTGGRGAIKAVQVKGSGSGSWLPMRNSWGATWELSNAPAPPLDFQIQTDDGEQVTASSVIKQNGGISMSGNGNSAIEFDTGAQFPINDPAVMKVQAFAGGSDGDPMLVTSDTPGSGGSGGGGEPTMSVNAPPNSASAPSSPSSTAPPSSGGSVGKQQGCSDIPPPGDYSCAQQKLWQKCDADFMLKGNFCRATCGKCSGIPSVQVAGRAPQGKGGRKLLRRQ